MPSAAERFLVDFHAEHTGATSIALGDLPVRCQAAEFESSYDLLAAQVPQAAARVLDLACGDGFLLSRLARTPGRELAGVDMSAAELGRARDRLQGAAHLIQCRAQELPFPDGHFDAVVSHMALMLMDESDQVLAEVHRVLRSQGQLAAVVGAPFPSSPPFDAYRSLLQPHFAGSATRVAIGDPHWRTPDGTRQLLQQTGFREIAISDVDGELTLAPAQLWSWLMLMYDAHFVDAPTRESLRMKYLSTVSAMTDAQGKLRVPIRWVLVLGVK